MIIGHGLSVASLRWQRKCAIEESAAPALKFAVDLHVERIYTNAVSAGHFNAQSLIEVFSNDKPDSHQLSQWNGFLIECHSRTLSTIMNTGIWPKRSVAIRHESRQERRRWPPFVRQVPTEGHSLSLSLSRPDRSHSSRRSEWDILLWCDHLLFPQGFVPGTRSLQIVTESRRASRHLRWSCVSAHSCICAQESDMI